MIVVWFQKFISVQSYLRQSVSAKKKKQECSLASSFMLDSESNAARADLDVRI
jgi:hypothetical protein